jgi:hypothetical protein
VLRTRSPVYSPLRAFSLDLHVLGTPPAFVLSQDQTLQLYSWSVRQLASLTFTTKFTQSIAVSAILVSWTCYPVFKDRAATATSHDRLLCPRLFSEGRATYRCRGAVSRAIFLLFLRPPQPQGTRGVTEPIRRVKHPARLWLNRPSPREIRVFAAAGRPGRPPSRIEPRWPPAARSSPARTSRGTASRSPRSRRP